MRQPFRRARRPTLLAVVSLLLLALPLFAAAPVPAAELAFAAAPGQPGALFAQAPVVPAATCGPGSFPVRVMPIGDSITEGEDGHASYRYWLWHGLRGAHYSGIDFVGSQFGPRTGQALYQDFDQDHEGHGGYRVDQILAGIQDWASAYQPHIALIHLGTNDLRQEQTVESTISELGRLIDALRAVNPSVVVLLAQIIPRFGPYGADIEPLNAQIPTLAAQKTTAQSPVVVVDQWTGFDENIDPPVGDTYDGVHPDESGEKKLAAKWQAALLPYLDCAYLPHSVQLPLIMVTRP
ncbi:MAG: SGNH/GDSL hydrolase family protein [Chloroflexota bacterium]